MPKMPKPSSFATGLGKYLKSKIPKENEERISGDQRIRISEDQETMGLGYQREYLNA